MKTGDSQGPGGDGLGEESDGVHGSGGGAGKTEGSPRGETGGPDTMDDGDGGPDDKSDGEVTSANLGLDIDCYVMVYSAIVVLRKLWLGASLESELSSARAGPSRLLAWL